MDKIAVAGPLSATVGGNWSGSCFVYSTDERTIAEALLHNDPYYRAGLYEEVEFRAFRPAVGTWIGGASWLPP